MEHFYLSLLLLFVSFITLSLFIIFYNHNSNLPQPNVPPGSFGFPFIGQSFEFLSYGWKGHPEKFIFTRMTKYSSHAFKTSLLGEPTAVLCGPAGNKFLSSNENNLVTSWWPDSVNKIFPFTSNSSSKCEAKKMRKLLLGFLKSEALQRYIDIMDQIAQSRFVAHWEHKDEVIVYSLAEKFTILLACRLLLSIEDPHPVARFSDPFYHLLASGVLSMPIDFPGIPLKASSFVRKELRTIIEQRKIYPDEGEASPTQHILSRILLTSDENGNFLTDLDIADKILASLIGGHGSGRAVCIFVVKYRAELPPIYAEVYKEQMEIAKSKATSESLNWDDIRKTTYSWNVACHL
ncbi:hypothetical protein AB3S75_018191 [Citrus x aurantiifolia]